MHETQYVSGQATATSKLDAAQCHIHSVHELHKQDTRKADKGTTPGAQPISPVDVFIYDVCYMCIYT